MEHDDRPPLTDRERRILDAWRAWRDLCPIREVEIQGRRYMTLKWPRSVVVGGTQPQLVAQPEDEAWLRLCSAMLELT